MAQPRDQKGRFATTGASGRRITATPGNAAKTRAAMAKLKAEKKANKGKRTDIIQEEKRKERNRVMKAREAKVKRTQNLSWQEVRDAIRARRGK